MFKKITSSMAVVFVILLMGGCHDSQTAVDAQPPTVTGMTPQDGNMRVDTRSRISITFSEAMNRGKAESALTSVPALPPGAFTWSGNTMTFTPDNTLAGITEYSVTVGTGAADLAGNHLASAQTVHWKTLLSYRAVNLQSDFAGQTSNSGVFPSADGRYIFWGDGTNGEGAGCDIHLYRVKLSDLSSLTVWTNRSFNGAIYDDGTDTWAGSYYPYSEGVRIPASNPLGSVVRGSLAWHGIALSGNRPGFSHVYFGNSTGDGIGYWNRADNTTGIIPGSGAYIYQSAVIGDNVYFPRGYVSTEGIMVVDAVNGPTTVVATLLAGDSRIAGSSSIYSDNAYLYVHNGATHETHKIDPAGTGSIVATFSPGLNLHNPVVIDNVIYAGVPNAKSVYKMDKNSGTMVTKDCSAYLPTAVGVPAWDRYNDGIWFGPNNTVQTTERIAYFIPRSMIDNSCQ